MSPPQVWFQYIEKTRAKIKAVGKPRFWEFKKKRQLRALREDLESYHRVLSYYSDAPEIKEFYARMAKEGKTL